MFASEREREARARVIVKFSKRKQTPILDAVIVMGGVAALSVIAVAIVELIEWMII